jgi:phosphoglycerate dehydrogenase-like enzyme
MKLEKQSSRAPLGLLLSHQAARDFGPRIAEILKDVPYRLVTPDEAPDANGDYTVHAAFVSRDVTGKSTKTELVESLLRFYEMFRNAPELAWVHGHSAGADRPIYGELRKRGVTVTTSSGANAEAVAQMVLAGVLALARRLPVIADAQRRKAWESLLGPRAPRDLRNQTAVIVGMGPIGQEAARLLKAVRMRVIGVRRTATPVPPCDDVISFADWQTVLPQADWLILACPLTEETRAMLHAKTLAQLPQGAHLVNVARGEVAVESDVIAALQSGRLAGAFLDVFEKEPLVPTSPLWEMPNVIVSPHSAGHTTGHYAAVGEIFLDNLARWRDGRTMRNLMA